MTKSNSTPEERANNLLQDLIETAERGVPKTITYTDAYAHIADTDPTPWSQAYTTKVLKDAKNTDLKMMPHLGKVRLDTFIVAKTTGMPSDGHWGSVGYSVRDWKKAFGKSY